MAYFLVVIVVIGPVATRRQPIIGFYIYLGRYLHNIV